MVILKGGNLRALISVLGEDEMKWLMIFYKFIGALLLSVYYYCLLLLTLFHCNCTEKSMALITVT